MTTPSDPHEPSAENAPQPGSTPGPMPGTTPGSTPAGPGATPGSTPAGPGATADGPSLNQGGAPSFGQQAPYQQPGHYDPTGQPPYAQPGQPPYVQPGQPPYVQPGMAPVQPVPNKNKNRNIVLAVLAVIAIAAVAFFVIRSRATDTVNAGVGDCIQVVDANSTPPKTNQIACGDARSTYVVTETGNNVSCDQQEAEFTQDNTDLKICLRPDLKVGDCAKVKGSSNGDMEKIDCASATASDIKVAAFDQTSSDKSKCTDGQVPLAFAKRNMIFCFAPAKS